LGFWVPTRWDKILGAQIRYSLATVTDATDIFTRRLKFGRINGIFDLMIWIFMPKKTKILPQMKSICYAVAGFFLFVSAASAGEILPVVSIAGAKCTITRDGKIIADFVEPGTDEKHTARFVPIDTLSHDDIVIACSKDGYKERSQSLSMVSGRWIDDSAPCIVPKSFTGKETQAYCAEHYPPGHENPVVMEYPLANLILEHK
jgi:hypothetical protein